MSKDDKREIYFLDYNKYDKPISNITVIRKNPNYLDNKNSIIVQIYISLCNKMLNYYLETIKDYYLTFSIGLLDEYIIYNYSGIDYVLNKFINDITTKTNINYILYSKKSKNYFEKIQRDIIQNLENFKFISPFQLCNKYLSMILSNDMMPHEMIKYLENKYY